jgi:hypothetical protein
MTNPTTPFSWQMPTSTDLVTDLPADFETFGQAVATSMADLLGGTSGQVLSKASNADMDFAWVTSDDANAIQNTIVDAKGDLIGATAADTPARLAVGTNGQVLTADSTAATGLKWNTISSGMNLLNTTTFSAVSSQTIDSLFSSTYENYCMIINISAVSAANTNILGYFRSAGADVTSNNNTENFIQYSTSLTGASTGSTIEFGRASSSYASFSNFIVDIFNPELARITTISSSGGWVIGAGVPYQYRSFGYNGSTTQMTGIKLYPSTGTMTGEVSIYGLAK